jgi:hypothetical protein
MLLRLCVLVLISALSGSTSVSAGIIPHLLYGKRIAGQVVDSDSGKPIPGVHVALLWRSGIIPSGFTGHNSRDICYHAAAAITDEKGRFDIPSWHKWSTYDVLLVDPVVLLYVQGYAPVQKGIQSDSNRDPAEHVTERYELRTFRGNPGERLHSLFFGLANQGCDYGGDSQKALYPMLKAIYLEARAIAQPEMRPHVRSFAVMAANAAIAADPLGPSNDREVDFFIRENLQ